MDTRALDAFLEENKGYIKKGSLTLLEILKDKGYDISNLSQSDVKAILRLKAKGYTGKKIKPLKVLTYDIETSAVLARVWGTGKQYVGHDALREDTQIITIAWKWMGSNQVEYLEWSRKKRNDKKLVKKFLEVYNQADMVIGWNNNMFDNKIVAARAMKYNLDINLHVKSFDIMKQLKRVVKLPSYSMSYVAKYLNLGAKLQHSGIKMWEDICWGDKVDYKQSMALMVKYNIQDVALAEEIFFAVRKYLGHVSHLGALQGKSKATCPHCGGDKVKLYKTTVTAAGTIQRIMKCKNDGVTFKISNTEYLKNF